MVRVVRYDAILAREFKGRFCRVDAQAGIREAQVGSAFQWQDSGKNSERSCRQGRQGDRP